LANLTAASISKLIGTYAEIEVELRRRGVLRTNNGLVGDLSEYLFCAAFSCRVEPNSNTGFDARDEQGIRYQIKGRRVTRDLGAIRGLNQDHFHMLAGIIFTNSYRVHRAALIPIEVVKRICGFSKHVNANILTLSDRVWENSGLGI
jgi:hypothetical protein